MHSFGDFAAASSVDGLPNGGRHFNAVAGESVFDVPADIARVTVVFPTIAGVPGVEAWTSEVVLPMANADILRCISALPQLLQIGSSAAPTERTKKVDSSWQIWQRYS